jgi:hypothetical protein
MVEYNLDSDYLSPEEGMTNARVRRGYKCTHNDIINCPIISTDSYPKTRAKRRVIHERIESN